MADIDSIIAGVGGGTRADFTKLPGILDSFYKGRDQAYQQEGRDLFKDGIPTTADGQPDFAAMGKALFQHGDMGQGIAASNLDLARQQLKLGQQVSGQMGSLEGGQPAQPIVGPSTSRNSVTIDPSKRADANAPAAGQPQQQPAQSGQPATVMTVLAAQGIPNDQLGAASASLGRQLGVGPTDPININDPQVRNVLVPAVQQLKRMGIGQAVPQGQPTPAPQPVNPQQDQGTFGAPPATPTRGAVPTGQNPEIQRQIAQYTALASNPALPKSVQEAAMTRLKALQDQGAPTGPIKEYDLAVRQGYKGTFQDFNAENEAKKTAAIEDAKVNIKKYESLVEAGTHAQQEIPQLQMLQTQMNDPNFFSGAGEKYNLLYKRLKSAVGIDPDAPVPQELLRKVTASNVLSSLGALKGMGQIRNAEIKMAQTASAAPDNSIPANKLLVEIALRTHQRNADIADMAQSYKENNGQLDAGFDKQVTQYGRRHPLFSDAEIKDFHNVIGQAKAAPSSNSTFNSPADVHAAVASGRLKKGDTFTDPNGVRRMVP